MQHVKAGVAQMWCAVPTLHLQSIALYSAIFRWFYSTQLLLVRSSDNDIGSARPACSPHLNFDQLKDSNEHTYNLAT